MIKVQCPICKKKVNPLDLRSPKPYIEFKRMCLDCRGKYLKLDEKKNCKKVGCDKMIWIEPSEKNKSIIHQYCEQHQKEKNLEIERIMQQWEKGRN